MTSTQQFSLKWPDYLHHVTYAFDSFRNENDLVDVTLSCEGRKIKAHKMVLSACSAYFKDIFKENPCRHPVIIFRNVKFADLSAIIDFMYHGEVNILQDQLTSFLTTAELLEVQGLTDSGDSESSPVIPSAPEPKKRRLVEEPINLTNIVELKQHDYLAVPSSSSKLGSALNDTTQIDEAKEQGSVSIPGNSKNTNAAVVDNARTETFIKLENTSDNDVDMSVKAAYSAEYVRNDSQTILIEDTSDRSQPNDGDLAKFRCQLCPKGFKHPTSLTLHKDLHTGKTRCPICLRAFSRSYDMRSHIQRIHQDQHMSTEDIRNLTSNTSC